MRVIDIPAVVVKDRQFLRRSPCRIGDRSDQPVYLIRSGQRVFDHPQPERHPAGLRGRDDFGDIGTIRQQLHRPQSEVRVHSPQQVSTRVHRLFPPMERVDVPIGQHQHSRAERTEHLLDQHRFRGGIPIHPGVEHRMRAQLDHTGRLNLRVRRLTLTTARTGAPELAIIVWRVRHRERGPVHRRQQPVPIPRTPCFRACHRPHHRTGRCFHRTRAQPAASIADRSGSRHPIARNTATEHRHQDLHRRPVRLLRKKTQHQREIEHQPGGQRPRPLFPTPVLVNNPIDQLHRKRPGQHTDRGPVGHADTRARTRLKIHNFAGYRPRHDLTDRHWG